jgi:hypothetical protein
MVRLCAFTASLIGRPGGLYCEIEIKIVFSSEPRARH